MSLESFLRASQWLSLRSLTRGLPSFCLCWGQSSGVMSNPTAASSSGLGMVASQSDEQCHCLVPVGGAGITDTVGGEAVDVSSLPAVASCRVVACIPNMAASSMLPVRSCKDTLVPHGLWVDMSAGLPHMSPGMLGNPTLPLLLPHVPTLACFPFRIFPRHLTATCVHFYHFKHLIICVHFYLFLYLFCYIAFQ